MRVARPRADLVARRLARRHVRQPVASRKRGVEAGGQRPEVGRDLRRELHADLARAPASQAVRVSASHSKASAPSATNAWAIATVDVPSRTDTSSANPASRRHGREARLLAQERGHLEFRVEPGLEPSVRLEHQAVSPSTTEVLRLVRAELPFRARGDLRCAARHDRGARARAGRRGRPWGRSASGSVGRAATIAPLRHRDRQGPPRAVAGSGLPQRRRPSRRTSSAAARRRRASTRRRRARAAPLRRG